MKTDAKVSTIFILTKFFRQNVSKKLQNLCFASIFISYFVFSDALLLIVVNILIIVVRGKISVFFYQFIPARL